MVLAALVAGLGSGCKIGDCVETAPSGGGGHLAINPMELLVGLVVGLPIYFGEELYWAGSQYCEDTFYDYPGNREGRGRYWQRLHVKAFIDHLDRWTDYSPPRECFQEFDETGARREEFYVFTVFMDSEYNVHGMSYENARYVARRTLDDPDLMEWIPKIWKNRHVGLDLRNQALDRLHYRNSANGKLFKWILDNPCYTDGMLEEIMWSTANEHESRAAFKVLRARVERAKAE